MDIRSIDPDAPAAQACLAAYFALLVAAIPGVTAATFVLPDPLSDSYRPPNGDFLIAGPDAAPLGCVSLRPLSPGIGEVKRLWVAPAARGQGLARHLMTAIESRARGLGLTHLRLDTNAALTSALTLYRATGWREIPAYSGPPSTHWFEKTL